MKIIQQKRDDMENARIGYQTALEYAANEKQLVWIRSSGMIVSNSIIIAVSGSLFNTAAKGEAVSIVLGIAMVVLSLIGALICLLWMHSVEYTTKMSSYYLWSARKLEEKHLAPTVTTFEYGGILSNDEEERKKFDLWNPFQSGKCEREFGKVTIYTNTAVKTIQMKGLLTLLWKGPKDICNLLFRAQKKMSSALCISFLFIVLHIGGLVLSVDVIFEVKTKQSNQEEILSQQRANKKNLMEVRERIGRHINRIYGMLEQIITKIDEMKNELRDFSDQQYDKNLDGIIKPEQEAKKKGK